MSLVLIVEISEVIRLANQRHLIQLFLYYGIIVQSHLDESSLGYGSEIFDRGCISRLDES